MKSIPVVIVLVASLTMIARGEGQANPLPADKQPHEVVSDLKNVAEGLEALKAIRKTPVPPTVTNGSQMADFLCQRAERSVVIMDKILSMQPAFETRKELVTSKIDHLNFLERLRQGTYAGTAASYAAEIANDPEPQIAVLGERGLMKIKLSKTPEMTPFDALQEIDQAKAYVLAREPHSELLPLASSITWAADHVMNADSKIGVYQALADHLQKTTDESVAQTAEILQGTIRRFLLPGHLMQFTGRTIDGNEFNPSTLDGKAVLVNFWATWCVPCTAKFPHLKELYSQYHPKGFEIVAISLDQNKDVLNSFLEKHQVTWITLHNPVSDGEKNWQDPNAKHYGVNAIPQMFLIGRDGKVISVDLGEEKLDELLAKMFAE